MFLLNGCATMNNHVYFLHRNGDLVKTLRKGCIEEIEKRNYTDRTFKISYPVYRKLAGAAMEMFRQAKNEIIFLTYTTSKIIEHEKINKAWSKHLCNLKKTYKVNSYLWVAELQKRGAIHYHCLFDIPYIDIRTLNDSWNNSISHLTNGSKCAVRISPEYGAIVKSPERAVKYLCKYFSKAILTPLDKFYARVYGISHNINLEPVELSKIDYEVILNTTRHKRKTFEYADVYFLKDFEKSVVCYFDEPEKTEMDSGGCQVLPEKNLDLFAYSRNFLD